VRAGGIDEDVDRPLRSDLPKEAVDGRCFGEVEAIRRECVGATLRCEAFLQHFAAAADRMNLGSGLEQSPSRCETDSAAGARDYGKTTLEAQAFSQRDGSRSRRLT